MLEQDGFSAAAGTHDDEDLTGFDLEVQAFEHLLAVKTLAEPADLNADALVIGFDAVHGSI